MQLTTYLNFCGSCEAAFLYYAEIFGGKVAYAMKFGESPMADKVPAEMKDKIMHATLEVPGGVLMGADHPQGRHVQPAGFCVSVGAANPIEGERIFKALSEGGKVQMEFQKTFWSPGFGMCIDKFEIPWMINCTPQA